MSTPDPFAPLDRVVAKYRRDVHHLASEASAPALTSLEGHLQRELPPGLRSFLARHNGATLFRGTLRIRSCSEISLASTAAPQVVLFADDHSEVSWAWSADGLGGFAFGPWDGDSLDALHATFAGWLSSTLAVFDTRVRRPEDRDALRFEADPDDPYQLVRAGERALRSGNPDEAEALLRQATTTAPSLVQAWQLLGDALTAIDRSSARRAWLQAFRTTRFPLPWPGAPCIDPDVLRSLSATFADAEGWERELERFLEDQVRDVSTAPEGRVVVAVTREMARSRMQRGRRSGARDALSALLRRCRTFTRPDTPWDALLELASMEIDLGNHDEAEALLRRLRREGPEELQGPGHLLLARIAIIRQEPWAEDVLHDAEAHGLDDLDGLRVALLRIERSVRQERLDEVPTLLERARRGARRVAIRSLHAGVSLAEGDAARAAGDLRAADAAYRRGLGQLPEVSAGGDDPELRHRLQLRLGDIAHEVGRLDEAARSYQAAAEGFAAHQLPVREGWSLLRLARLSSQPAPLLKAARVRFAEADLAAGIAAADAIAGEPGSSLSWHLERATAQARARHDAQRSRPPWERCDADRPERRLGAHRLAIAACDERIVSAIAAEMAACARSMSSGRGRALDPPVLRYIAAVDLLAGHRSYSAAQQLLHHLLSATVEGTARRALQGAVARSPNAALVDGLLSCVESPNDSPSHAVAAAAEVLGLRRESAATRALVGLVGPGTSPVVRKASIVALGRIGDRGVVEHVLGALEEPSLAEQAALALLMLGDRRGIDFHGRALAENRRDLSGSPGEIVGRYGGPSYLILLKSSAEGTDERALGALQGLGLMGDPRAIPALLRALSNRDLRAVEVANGALQILTGRDEDIGNPGFRARWNTWFESEGHRMAEGVRHRDGQVFDASLLIDKMEHPDAWVRRTAYDELVITTGCGRPFDSDGPWRVQRAHLAAWRDWWRHAQAEQVPGSWYLDGRPIS